MVRLLHCSAVCLTQDHRPACNRSWTALPRATCLLLACPSPPPYPSSKQRPALPANRTVIYCPEDPAVYDTYIVCSCFHVPLSPGTACRMASYNDYHAYYDSRSRARSRSRPPPLQPQYEQYDAVPRSHMREDTYLSPTVPYAI